jgi:hypothetical protein
VESHPIRVVVTDDLARSRLTVFFRLLLAIPHIIWFILWTIAAIVAAIANWIATLVRGISPLGLHRFLAAYVRYATHFYAYLYLAANRYPAFDGSPGYPVDVEIDQPACQNRWKTAFRLILGLPALILSGILTGAGPPFPSGSWQSDDSTFYADLGATGVLAVIAVLAWFACLVRGRMPRGFRDLEAYALRFSAQASAYLFLLTDRYPDSNPEEPHPPQHPPVHPVALVLDDDLRRSRLTVFFRLLLAIPHIVWLFLWGIAVFFAAIGGWFATLVTGRMPSGLHRFLAAYVRYWSHVSAFLYLVANPFPGFTGVPGYPLDLAIDPPEAQDRWTTGFRVLLAIPAFIVASALGSPLLLVGVFGWFVSLALGRMPVGLRNLGAYVIRYEAQVYGYALLVTGRYPDSGPLQRRPEDDEAQLELEVAPVL